MRTKLLSVFGACALFAGLSAPAFSQNLYVTNMQVQYPIGSASDHYCETSPDGTDTNVSYLTADPISGNPLLPEDWSARIESEHPRLDGGGHNIYPGGCLKLCAQINCVVQSTPTTFGIDSLTFEIFKFGGGSNPLDPASTPPIKTIPIYNVGTCSQTSGTPTEQTIGGNGHFFCAAWTGDYNLNGLFGKTNGQFGYRTTVKTNQVSATAGNIAIQNTSAYPGQTQRPITVDVVDIHTVRSSPTVVGKITGVGAQPYNILYRLSKGASTTISIFEPPAFTNPVRHVIVNTPRVGEGIPDGTLTNGDFWDGRDDNGQFMPAGTYEAFINASAADYFGMDWAGATTYVELDPLQITDVAIKPLGSSSTDYANISYMLTEAATVYVNIFTPGTSITGGGAGVNDMSFAGTVPGYSGGSLVRSFTEQKTGRQSVSTIWDGMDSNNQPVCDGDYVYAVYAEMPGHGGAIRTTKLQTGTVPVARGNVVAMLNFSSTVIGSSPTATNLNPFYFRYTPVRDTNVSMNILDDSSNIVRHVAYNVPRTGGYNSMETWDGKDDKGLYVPAGAYQAQLVTTDPFQCTQFKTSSTTVRFSADLFRIVDLKTAPLLGGTSDMANISFELSQPMYIQLNVYATSVTINPWQIWAPGVNPLLPNPLANKVVYSVEGMRPGRYHVTEYWDGRDSDGLLVPDGRYPFALVAYTTSPVTTAQTMYATDQAYGYVDISRGQIIFSMFDVTPTVPTMYNSSDSIKLPPYEIDYSVTRQSSVTVQVLTLESQPHVIANVISGQIRDGDVLYKDFWDGKDDSGNWANGYGGSGGVINAYNVRVTAQDISAQLASKATVQMTIDVNPLRIYDVAITPLTDANPAVVSYQISEPMKMVTKVYKPGTTFNSYGAPSPAESTSLVKRIVGVRPARTKVEEYWDGTDMNLTRVPDGDYVFKVFGSTMTDSVDSLTGALVGSPVLADDTITSDLPVTKGNVYTCADFESNTNTFFSPNPYTGQAGWFHIPLFESGQVTLRLYNLVGDLIYSKDFGTKAVGADIGGSNNPCLSTHTNEACWPKVNNYGKTVAPGVYFAVIRFAATEGTRDVCQTVKKILVP